jgi:HD superfamily phosphodiesterase
MMGLIGQVMRLMLEYYAGDLKRVNHFMKVYGFAKAIGEGEGLDEKTQLVLEIAALTHDIGIKNSERKYNSAAGNHQQVEGPPEARKLLEQLKAELELIDRVCWLIAHHHTYTDINDEDYQILVEADFIVNACEDNMSHDAMQSVVNKVFKTKSGREYFNILYFPNC